MKWSILCAAALLTASGSPAFAGVFDERGKLSMDGGFTMSFESNDVPVTVIRAQGSLGALSDEQFIVDEDGLEGTGALRFGGPQRQALVRTDALGPELAQFDGRRVEVTVWYKSEGTALVASMRWLSGNISNRLNGSGGQPAVDIGRLQFQPTGRETSDGWVELSSGPVDWTMGGELTPGWINLYDQQHVQSFTRQGTEFEASSTVLIDALEITDLGPALIAPEACTAGTEEDVCGEMGACWFGRCVDSASAYSAPPQGEDRTRYLLRRFFELDMFGAIRRGRLNLATIRMMFEAMTTTSPKVFWRTLSQGVELMVDGHSRPPSFRGVDTGNSAGICLGPGTPDLLLGVQTQPLPMVFERFPDDYIEARLVQVGDVITAIDGIPYTEWMSENQWRFFYNGDPGGRDVITMNSLMTQAQRAGSVVTFSRCPSSPNTAEPEPCAPGDVITVDVDFSETLGRRVWTNNPPGNWSNRVFCDFRFNARVQRAPEVPVQTFARSADIEGIRHLVINAVPSRFNRDGSNNSWGRNVESALNDGPRYMVLDQRTGFGGSIDSVNYIVGFLFDASNDTRGQFYPWLGEPTNEALEFALARCFRATRGDSNQCAQYIEMQPTAFYDMADSKDTKLAVVSGFDVSGNDYLPKFLKYRAAETRFFGYGPTIGAFGVSCSLPGLIGEEPMGYQCHDTRFTGPSSAGAPREDFTSGFGVEQDEIIYQSQRDALMGIDTILEAAEAWLNVPEEEQP
ncbi:MAG: hypothetical protein AAGI01_08590 [Myxococcota bacterium]